MEPKTITEPKTKPEPPRKNQAARLLLDLADELCFGEKAGNDRDKQVRQAVALVIRYNAQTLFSDTYDEARTLMGTLASFPDVTYGKDDFMMFPNVLADDYISEISGKHADELARSIATHDVKRFAAAFGNRKTR